MLLTSMPVAWYNVYMKCKFCKQESKEYWEIWYTLAEKWEYYCTDCYTLLDMRNIHIPGGTIRRLVKEENKKWTWKDDDSDERKVL